MWIRESDGKYVYLYCCVANCNKFLKSIKSAVTHVTHHNGHNKEGKVTGKISQQNVRMLCGVTPEDETAGRIPQLDINADWPKYCDDSAVRGATQDSGEIEERESDGTAIDQEEEEEDDDDDDEQQHDIRTQGECEEYAGNTTYHRGPGRTVDSASALDDTMPSSSNPTSQISRKKVTFRDQGSRARNNIRFTQFNRTPSEGCVPTIPAVKTRPGV